VARWRDEDGKGDRFSYSVTNQLTVARYKADNAWTGNARNWASSNKFNYTPDMLNRTSVNESGSVAPYTANALNQYTNINGSAAEYDGRFNLYRFGGF
jgi:hypothetical protein